MDSNLNGTSYFPLSYQTIPSLQLTGQTMTDRLRYSRNRAGSNMSLVETQFKTKNSIFWSRLGVGWISHLR